jgi:hypothetical protein
MQFTIFAFDFSMNKPAMTVYCNGKLDFYVWPSNIDEKSYNTLTFANVNVTNRNLPTMKEVKHNQHTLILEHVNRAVDLANIIVNTINGIVKHNKIDKNDVIIANESFAFSAKGDAVLDLSGYKYILMYTLMINGYKNFKTYSPISIKKTADWSKKGLGKDAMIEAFGKAYDKKVDYKNHFLMETLLNNPQNLKKKTNYVLCMDDIADSYWCMITAINDEHKNS